MLLIKILICLALIPASIIGVLSGLAVILWLSAIGLAIAGVIIGSFVKVGINFWRWVKGQFGIRFKKRDKAKAVADAKS